MPDFYTSDHTPGRPKRLKAQHGTRQSFHRSMVLLHEIIQIFGVADDNGGLVRLVVALDRRRVAAALIDSDLLRQSLSANGFA